MFFRPQFARFFKNAIKKEEPIDLGVLLSPCNLIDGVTKPYSSVGSSIYITIYYSINSKL
jgi:hypothetical protein